MPDEPKPESQETPPEAPKPIDADAMRAAVVDGVTTAFKTVLQEAGQNASAPKPEAPPTEPPEPTTDDIDRQIDEAAAAGQPIAALLRKRDTIVEQRFERRMVQPLREQGAAAIGSLSAETIVNKPYYQKLKPDIERILATAPRGQVLTKAHYEWAYNLARGQRADELEQIATENAIRKSKEPPEANPPATAGRLTSRSEEVDENADFRTTFGDGTAAVFRRKTAEQKNGRTEDQEAQMLGFKDRKEMMKVRREFEESDDFSLGLDK